MRIFLYLGSSANWQVLPESQVWTRNLLPAFQRLASHLFFPSFDVGQQIMACIGQLPGAQPAQARARYSEILVQDVKHLHQEHGLDLFFSYMASVQVLPEAIEAIRALGIPTVNFYCNAAHQFHQVAEIAPHFDWCMVPEAQAVPKYRAVGARPLHIQMAADPETYRPFDVAEEFDVTFVGQRYLNRPDTIAYLNWHGIDARAWGPHWEDVIRWEDQQPWRWHARRVPGKLKRFAQRVMGMQPAWYPLPRRACGPLLSDEDMVKMYSHSRISLNISEVKDEITGEIKRHIRLRDFEGPMSGAFFMTGYQEELADYYEIGREIVCYDTKEELLDKVRYYLRRPEERLRIRLAGLNRARRDHTWDQRLRQLLREIGLAPVAKSNS